MAGTGEEDYFDDDDGLDDLSDSELKELEHNAIQFTQAQTQAIRAVPAPSSDYGDEFDVDDLEDQEVVIDEGRSTPAIVQSIQRGVPGQVTQQEQFRQQRYGTINSSNSAIHLASRPRPTPPRFDETRTRPQTALPQYDSLAAEQGSQSNVHVESLQKQLEETIKERETLKNELKSKAGEISIVRSKQDKAIKDHERELAYLRKHHEEELAKKTKELEAARNAQQAAATEREFLGRELAEEGERNRRLARAKEAEKKTNPTTPKKKQAPYRDGFDDDEIELISPSKISPLKFQKRQQGSPSKAAQRKRKHVESPAGAKTGALEVYQAEVDKAQELVEQKPTALDEAILAKLSLHDGRFDFISSILDHRLDAKHLRTLEEFGKYAFPSAPDDSLQSLILAKIPSLGLSKDSKNLPVDFCMVLISLWKQCMAERYIDPMHMLIDMLTFALEKHTSIIAPLIVDELLPVAQHTVDAVVVSRYKSTIELESWAENINPTPTMHLLYLTAQGCMSEPENIKRFWRLIGWKFSPVLISPSQEEEDYLISLKLLSTSVMKETFGAICLPNDTLVQMDLIINAMLFNVYQIPFKQRTNEYMSGDQLYRLRFHTLQLFISMTRSPVASKALAVHPSAIGQFVHLVSDQLDNLYDYKFNTKQCAQLIGLTMRLIFHLVTKYEEINMQQKLTTIPGGSQKYLLSLSRLNFSEDDLLLESGIDADIVPCALELLERFVSPEEADAIHDAFSAS